MTRNVATCLTTGALVLGLGASVATGAQPTVMPPLPATSISGEGLGKLRIGMPAYAAQRILRRTGVPFLVRTVRMRAGVKYVEAEYRARPWLGASYAAGFLGPSGSRKLVMVATYLRRHGTDTGVRVGTRLRPLLRAYPQQLRCDPLRGVGTRPNTACRLPTATGELVFVLPGDSLVVGRPDTYERWMRVLQIQARQRGLHVPIA